MPGLINPFTEQAEEEQTGLINPFKEEVSTIEPTLPLEEHPLSFEIDEDRMKRATSDARVMGTTPDVTYQESEFIDNYLKENNNQMPKDVTDTWTSGLRKWATEEADKSYFVGAGKVIADIMDKAAMKVGPSAMEAIGGLVEAKEDWWAAYKEPIRNLYLLAQGMSEEEVKNLPPVKATEYGKYMADFWGKVLEDMQKSQVEEAPSTLRKYSQMIADNLAINMPWMILGIASENPALALGPLALQAKGKEYHEQRKGGTPPHRASYLSDIIGISEGLTEKLPYDELAKVGVPMVKRILHTALTDVPGEWINTMVESSISKLTIEPDMTLADFNHALMDTTIVALGSAGFMAAAAQPLTMGRELEEERSNIERKEIEKRGKEFQEEQEQAIVTSTTEVTKTREEVAKDPTYRAKQTIVAELEGADYTTEEATQVADLWTSFVETTVGEQFKEDPQAYLDKYKFDVKSWKKATDAEIQARVTELEQEQIEGKGLKQAAIDKGAEMVQTPEFQEWIKGTQVVNEDGSPMILYHGGTTDIELFESDEGIFYFSTSPQSSAAFSGLDEHRKKMREEPTGGVGRNITPVYLSLQKVWDFRNPEHRELAELWIENNISEEGYGAWGDRETMLKAIEQGEYGVIEDADFIQDVIIENGFDGFTMTEYAGGPINYGVFKQQDIKSIFVPAPTKADPRILFQKGAMMYEDVVDMRPEFVHASPPHLIYPEAASEERRNRVLKRWNKEGRPSDKMRKIVSDGKKGIAPNETYTGGHKNPHIRVKPKRGSGLAARNFGPVPVADWVEFVESQLDAETINRASEWYNMYPDFVDRVGEEKAPEMMAGFLLQNQGVSPTAAMAFALRINEQFSREQAGIADPTSPIQARLTKSPHPRAAQRAMLRGERVGSTNLKISDFIDSSAGKTTRSFYGDSPVFGQPSTIDIWQRRSFGFVDGVTITRLREQGYNEKDIEKLEKDVITRTSKGVTADAFHSDTQYEFLAEYGRWLTDQLNKRNWQGRSDWKAFEVQAIGWASERVWANYGLAPVSDAIESQVRKVSLGLDLSPGSILNEELNISTLPESAVPEIVEIAANFAGIPVDDVKYGKGGWFNPEAGQTETEPSSVIETLATDESLDLFMNTVGYLTGQYGMISMSSAAGRKTNDMAVRLSVKEDSDISEIELFETLNKVDPDLFGGFTPFIGDGKKGVNVAVTIGRKSKNEFTSAVTRDNLLNQVVPKIREAIENANIEAELEVNPIIYKESIGGEKGETYLSRVRGHIGESATDRLSGEFRAETVETIKRHLPKEVSFQEEVAPPIWTSELEQFLETAIPKKSDPKQLRQMIEAWSKPHKGKPPKIKPLELEYSGLLDYLDTAEGSITRTEVMDYLATNNVRLTDATFGEEGSPELKRILNEAIALADAAKAAVTVEWEEKDLSIGTDVMEGIAPRKALVATIKGDKDLKYYEIGHDDRAYRIMDEESDGNYIVRLKKQGNSIWDEAVYRTPNLETAKEYVRGYVALTDKTYKEANDYVNDLNNKGMLAVAQRALKEARDGVVVNLFTVDGKLIKRGTDGSYNISAMDIEDVRTFQAQYETDQEALDALKLLEARRVVILDALKEFREQYGEEGDRLWNEFVVKYAGEFSDAERARIAELREKALEFTVDEHFEYRMLYRKEQGLTAVNERGKLYKEFIAKKQPGLEKDIDAAIAEQQDIMSGILEVESKTQTATFIMKSDNVLYKIVHTKGIAGATAGENFSVYNDEGRFLGKFHNFDMAVQKVELNAKLADPNVIAAEDRIEEAKDEEGRRQTDHERWVPKGVPAENYKEMLITMPVRIDFSADARGRIGEEEWAKMDETTRAHQVAYSRELAISSQYQSGHFNKRYHPKNVVVHVRFDEIMTDKQLKQGQTYHDEEGNLLTAEKDGVYPQKVLRLIEIQSDWQQAAKKLRDKEVIVKALKLAKDKWPDIYSKFVEEGKTYRKGISQNFWNNLKPEQKQEAIAMAEERVPDDYGFKPTSKDVAKAEIARMAYNAYRAELTEKYGTAAFGKMINDEEMKKLVKFTDELVRTDVAYGISRSQQAVPDTPFKTSAKTSLIALKRMVTWAVHNNFDQVAWITGEMNTDIYTTALRKAVDTIQWTKTEKGVHLYGTKNNQKVVDTTEREDMLSDAVGKAMGKRILESPDRTGTIEGDDIEITDTGMRKYYDEIVPATANKFFKKFGAKVGETEMKTDFQEPPKGPYVVFDSNDNFFTNATTEERAIALAEDANGTWHSVTEYDTPEDATATRTIHSLPITPKLKEAVESQGFPLFQADKKKKKAPRAALSMTPDQITIDLFKKADASSIVHETGHVFFNMLKDLSSRKDAPQGVIDDYNTLRDWVGAEQGADLTEAQKEQLARGFEAYLREGVAPSKKLTKAFKTFRKWLTQVYRNAKEQLGVELTPEVRDVFDRMLATEAEVIDIQGVREDNVAVEQAISGVNLLEQGADFLEEIMGKDKSRSSMIKRRLRKATGLVKASDMIREDVALRAAWKKAEQASRKALSEGNKEGVEKERKRMKEMLRKARERVESNKRVRKLKDNILKELKTTKVKKQGGKPKGQFGADIQKILDKFREALKMDEDMAQSKINANLEKYQDKAIPDEVALENRILDMMIRLKEKTEAGGTVPIRKKFSEAELQSILDGIREMKETGKMMTELKKFNRESQDMLLVDAGIDSITGGKGLPKGIETTGVEKIKVSKLQARKWLSSVMNDFGVTFVGWNDLMDMLSGRDIKSAKGKSELSEVAEVHSAENAEKQGYETASKQIVEISKESFGFKNDSEMRKQFNIDAKETVIGTFVNARGARVELKMTKAEARKLIMEYLDPTLQDTFYEGMNYTEEMIKAVSETLTAQDRTFIQKQMEFYKSYYNRVNNVYRDIYGVDLPFNEFYSPIRREGLRGPEGMFSEFLDEVSYRRTTTTGSHKSRVQNIHRLKRQSDVNALEKHIAEMEHFIAWSEKIRQLNVIFSNPSVRAAMNLHHKPAMQFVIEKYINDFARGGIETAAKLDAWDKFRGNFTRSVLSAKGSITIKQLTSTIAYMENMPVTDFVKGVAEFWAHPIKHFKFLKENSAWFRARTMNMDRDIKTAMKMREYSAYREKKGFIDALMLNVALGDQGAIAIGGWSYYRYLKKKGMSHEKAIVEFEKVSELAQQSSDLSIQSHIQRAGSFAKLFTMFLSSPNLYLRKELGAIRGLLSGRGSVKDHMKTIAIYHIMLPMFFQLVSDMFDWDEDEQLRAVILGPLNGLFIVGDMLTAIYRKAAGLPTFGNEIAITGAAEDLGKATKEAVRFISEGDLTDEQFYRAVRGLAGATGAYTGLPLKQAVDQVKTGVDFVDGEFEKALKGLLGYSPYLIDKED